MTKDKAKRQHRVSGNKKNDTKSLNVSVEVRKWKVLAAFYCTSDGAQAEPAQVGYLVQILVN